MISFYVASLATWDVLNSHLCNDISLLRVILYVRSNYNNLTE